MAQKPQKLLRAGVATALVALAGILSGFTISTRVAAATSDCETNICNFGSGNCAFAPEENWNCSEILGGCSQSPCD